MRTFKALVVLLMGWFASWSEGSAGQYHWDNNAGTMPHEMNPPWTLISEGIVYAYFAPDTGQTTGHLLSTQAVDNVYFEQRGSSLQMTQPLVIQAVLRLVSGTSTSDKSGPVGFAFTVAENVGGSVWLNASNLWASAAGDAIGAITNLDVTAAYHTYRIEVPNVTSGSPFTVFVDNTAVLQGELHESPGNFGSEPRIQWGDMSPAAYGESSWLSFSHNAAAPFTTRTNPAVELACSSTAPPAVPTVSAPFLSLASEGRILDGTSSKYANLSLLFNTDNGIIYGAVQGGYEVLDANPRRTFTQSDGSQVTLFEFTDLSFRGIDVKITGSRAAAILATGDIQLVRVRLHVDAAGDPGASARTEHTAGFDAPAPLGGGGGRGEASGYFGGRPPFLVPSKLPTSGPGGGGFVTRGQDGFPAEPAEMWRYNREPTFDFTLLGTVYRPGGEGGGIYTDFTVLRGGGGGGSSSGTGFAGNAGFPGGHGGGALLLSTPGQIIIDSQSSVSVDGQMFASFLSEIAAGGAGGYLVLNGDRGIINNGSLSARGGGGRKVWHQYQDGSYVPWWGSCGDGGGGLIILKSQSGVTNNGALLIKGDSAEKCTMGVVQVQSSSFIHVLPSLSLPLLSTNQVSFTLPTALNALYGVQYNDDLNTTNWITFTNVTGTGLPASILVPTPDVTNRFFRVIGQ